MLDGYVLPYQGQEIAPSAIAVLIRSGWLPRAFAFPLIGYCAVCRRDVDTAQRGDAIWVCVVCFAPAQVYQIERGR